MAGSGSKLQPGVLPLALFCAPMLVCQAIDLSWRLFMPAFLATTAGLPLAAVAALIFWIRLLDAVTGPMVGIASDRWSTRAGRRRPWMVAAVPLICLGAAQLFFARPGDGVAAVAVACVLLHLGYTMLVVPHGGWGLELADTDAGRTRVMGFKMWAFLSGVPLTLGIPALMERWTGATLAAQMAALGWLIVALTAPLVLATVLTVPEPRQPQVRGPKQRGGMLQEFRRVVARPALARIMLLYAILSVADAAEGAVTLFFVADRMMLPGWATSGLLLPVVAGLVAMPLWTAFAMRVGQTTALVVVLCLRVFATPLALLLPAAEIAPLAALLCLRGLGLGVDYMLLRAMTARIVGDELADGRTGFAASHYALFNIATHVAGAIGAALALWALDRVGFVPGVSGSATAALPLLYALPSCVAGVTALILLWVWRGIHRRA